MIAECPTDIIIGKKRPDDNPLIVRYEVGKSRMAGVTQHGLDADFTYGMPSKRDPETAGEVVLTWAEHSGSKGRNDTGEKDFVRMNKKAIEKQCVTSKSLRQYRKENSLRVTKQCIKMRARADEPSKPMKVFGSKSKAEESVKDLMTNRFALEWVKEQQRLATARIAAEKKSTGKENKKRQFIHQPVSLIEEAPKDPKETFTLRKFLKIPAKICTRTPSPTRPPQGGILPPLVSRTPEPIATLM